MPSVAGLCSVFEGRPWREDYGCRERARQVNVFDQVLDVGQYGRARASHRNFIRGVAAAKALAAWAGSFGDRVSAGGRSSATMKSFRLM